MLLNSFIHYIGEYTTILTSVLLRYKNITFCSSTCPSSAQTAKGTCSRPAAAACSLPAPRFSSWAWGMLLARVAWRAGHVVRRRRATAARVRVRGHQHWHQWTDQG